MEYSGGKYGSGSQDRIKNISARDWKKEMAERAGNYHIIGAYVAVIFDPLFGITDYFNIPHAWKHIFILRVAISIITAAGIFLYRQNRITVYMLVAIPMTLISLQNAYTYRFIDDAQILGHNLNYIALFLGAALFLIWPMRYSLLAIGFSIFSTFWFVSSNKEIDIQNFAVEGGLLLLTSSIFTILMIQGRYRLKVKEVKATLALEESLLNSEVQRKEIGRQNALLKEQSEQLALAKEELSETNKSLEEKVEQRTQSLREANNEMDQLVYSLSHDFRTPMVNARGLVQVANDLNPSEMISGVLVKIADCLNRFDELLHDMMNYAVYWDKRLSKSEVGLKSVLENVWRDLEHQHKKTMSLSFDGLDDRTLWYSHPEKFRVLLYCILSNAVRFQKIKQPQDIEVKLNEGSEHTELIITDYGVGISQDSIPRVFEMYYRGNTASQGAGLGLYIAKGIITQIGGHISISSHENEGTQVKLVWESEVLQKSV